MGVFSFYVVSVDIFFLRNSYSVEEKFVCGLFWKLLFLCFGAAVMRCNFHLSNQ